MMYVILSLFLALFLISTIILGWFCFKATNKLLFFSENMEELYVRLDEFDQHINFIHELEMYYGDETLKNLIRHSRNLRTYMSSYRDIIELTAEENIDEEIDERNSKENDEDKDSENRDSRQDKTVFHKTT